TATAPAATYACRRFSASSTMASIAVLGAGAFGTALAIHCAARAHQRPRVLLYARAEAHAQALLRARVNERYLPGFALPPTVVVTSDIADCTSADLLLAAVPAAELTALLDRLMACNAR